MTENNETVLLVAGNNFSPADLAEVVEIIMDGDDGGVCEDLGYCGDNGDIFWRQKIDDFF